MDLKVIYKNALPVLEMRTAVHMRPAGCTCLYLNGKFIRNGKCCYKRL